ncbi:carotenoid biosynthesis protein [Mucilaginibacter jinjuensis]|uniref:Carotenoid biosynthesis protein n=1 Tax=Mucilaginibacter jinjuensis TaxID=1176721 RepID=A0ABY7T647_9SPHI|nr:carotenoid biosynthesis protein [Mucilaginibacter jinjuensis]WCT11683.1 carotenoid biosynthesis protein [Mucilaginibacter jinjuensis]
MERPPCLSAKAAKVIIVLFHTVGLIGLMLPATHVLFLKIVPFHLLLMLLVVFFNHKYIDERFLGFVILIYVLGFFAEWIGVHKGWLFGDYVYGETLGINVFEIPLTIGINWFLLIYSAGVTMQRLRIKSNWARIILGALVLVLLDMQIEPVAVRFDYWHWADSIVPMKNYVSWFLVSGLMLWIFEQFKFKKQSWVGPILLGVQFVFFGVLNLM